MLSFRVRRTLALTMGAVPKSLPRCSRRGPAGRHIADVADGRVCGRRRRCASHDLHEGDRRARAPATELRFPVGLQPHDEALDIQQALLKELEAAGEEDGYVLEEVGELKLAKGDASAAASYFEKAHAILAKDSWLQSNEPERLARLQRLARGEQP